MQVTEAINGPYKEYSKYVISHRAIPSAIDGFKTSQRKIIYTANETAKSKLKTASLAGNCVSLANYHHGAASLEGAISLMAGTWNNNICLLEGEGNFGSRLINDAAAPRYTHVRISNDFKKYFLDNDILQYYASPDLDDPEPRHYLPIIPWVLVNGIKGIAVGHATEIQPRDPKRLKRLCTDYLAGKDISDRDCLPHFSEFAGTVEQTEDGGYRCVGLYETISPTKMKIVELPIGIEREKYIQYLDKLEEDGTIVRYIDECSKNRFDFTIILKRNHKLTTHNKILSTFKLTRALSENLTTLDAEGKLRIFDSPIEIIKYFCDWRLEQYKVRYEHYTMRDTEALDMNMAIEHFLKAVLNGQIVMKNKSTDQIKTQMDKLSIPSKYHNKCLSLPISSFSKEALDKYNSKIKELKEALKTWQRIDTRQQMIQEIKEA